MFIRALWKVVSQESGRRGTKDRGRIGNIPEPPPKLSFLDGYLRLKGEERSKNKWSSAIRIHGMPGPSRNFSMRPLHDFVLDAPYWIRARGHDTDAPVGPIQFFFGVS